MRAAEWSGGLRALAGAALLSATLAVVAVAEPAPAAAAAETNLSYYSTSTWTADPVDARVHVSSVITATSHASGSGSVPYFYDDLELTLPAVATDMVATAISGQTLAVKVVGRSSSGQVVDIAFGQRLYAGQTRTLILTFDLVDAGGSTDRDIRIGHNLMSFPISAYGSPGTPGSSVTVVFPADFTVQEEFGSLTRAVFGSGEVVFTSGVLEDATTLSAWFTAVEPIRPEDLLTRGFMLGPLNVSLHYWADDPGWADQVQRVLQAGYPLLRSAIGLGDPAGTNLSVTEASSEEIGGFAGTYDQSSGQVQVSYLADPFVILHEAAHMWFNSSLASDRWIEEGFASYYAEQVVLELGYPDQAPLLSSRLMAAAVPFNDWVAAGVPSSATDLYLYGATLEAAREIADQAGSADLQKVWQYARDGVAAYQAGGSAPADKQAGPIDWQRFLDLLEQTTGQSFAGIWERWVVSTTQSILLTERASAVESYASLLSDAGTWTLPPEIRHDLDEWQFDQAALAMSQTRTILAERAQIVSQSIHAQTQPPDTLRTLFETAPVSTTATEAANELAALAAISDAAAAEAQHNGGGFLLGSDPAADLAAAREAFARGDVTTARSLALGASAAWRGGITTQLVRIAGLVVGSLGLLLLLGVLVWVSRTRRSWAAEPLPAEAGTSTRGLRAEAGVPAGRVATGRRHSLAGAGAGGGPDDLAADMGPGVISIMALGDEERVAPQARAGRPNGFDDADGFESTDGFDDAGGDPARGDPDLDGSATAAETVSEDGSTVEGSGDLGPGPEESAYELLQRGKALLRDRHNAQAAVVLERAARVEPGKGSILEALGRAYYNSGQHVRAAETFEALLEVDPSAHYGHFALGLSFARLGREPEARKHLRIAVALHPSNETYRKAL